MENKNASATIDRPLIKIFWTGGWDSTFRVVSLAKYEVVIQPYFIIMYSEKQSSYEINAINIITKCLQELESTKCIINKPIIINKNEIVKDTEITEAYNNLYKIFRLGEQYHYLARIAKDHKGIELGIEKDGGAYKAIKKIGKVDVIPCKTGSYYVLDKSISNNYLVRLFGNYHFPVFEKTKEEMRVESEAYGMIDILNKTWFCRHPVNNEPCGCCSPCRQAISKGMKHRFTDEALKRCRIKRFLFSLMHKLKLKVFVHNIEQGLKKL